jgi:hypothetical protein
MRKQIQVTIGEEIVPIHNRRLECTITHLHCLISNLNLSILAYIIGRRGVTAIFINIHSHTMPSTQIPAKDR